MTRKIVAALFAMTLLLSAQKAEAKWFEFWVAPVAGYGWGTGTTDKDFFKHATGGAIGAEIGVKILFIGLYADYLGWIGSDFDAFDAHLVTVNLGGDWALDLTDALSLVIRVGAGVQIGFLPPESNVVIGEVTYSQEATRGVGVRAGLGIRYGFAKVLSVGLLPMIGYHYYFGGPGTPVNRENSHGFDVTILAFFRLGLGV